ncbi:AraC family transcriptional regulator [Pseudomonas japonica]|uniref:Helix-turn-helix domain-containing protein n=1 Tax=Pseudomonas japonica TaxID=256466 RepID=A0A239EBA5_9PSED|nr:AraC family transcriptional regulator [Pseudomonas japonica]SNS41965.1 Helix-turn-helix domain-containing protein [Pseudomonas japonica]
MTTQPVLALLYLFNALRSQGQDLSPLLADHGLTEAQLAPGGRIERGLALRLMCDLARRLPRLDQGLELGQAFGFAGYGPVSFLLLTSETAYAALQCGLRYQQQTFLFSPLSFVPGERESALCLDPLDLPEPGRRFLIDVEMAGTYKLILDLLSTQGRKGIATRVEVPYPAPPNVGSYASFYGCPMHFGSDRARIWMRNDVLQSRLLTADPTAHVYYREQCEEWLRGKSHEPDNADLAAQVRSHLALFQQGFPAADEVARSLGIAERTLRFRLAGAGSSFRQLLDEARFARARRLLGDSQQSVEQVAASLGYAESAAFIRAFQRWAGCSPAAWRRAQRP